MDGLTQTQKNLQHHRNPQRHTKIQRRRRAVKLHWSSWVWAQPMGDDVIMQRLLSLVESISGVIPVLLYCRWKWKIGLVVRDKTDVRQDTLIHWGLPKWPIVCRLHFQKCFKEMIILFEMSSLIVLRVHSTVIKHWFRLWLGTEQATSHYPNQWWPIFFVTKWLH